MHVDATRAIIEITGEERQPFLQGLITQDLSHMRENRGLFAAMLSPQGKILHDFFVIPFEETILLDTDAGSKDALIKRLTMYKLRAKVNIRDATDEWRVAYRIRAQHAAVGHLANKKDCLVLTDPRGGELGERLYIGQDCDEEPKHTVTPQEYHDHRIRLGIPDGARDIVEDVALDAGYDALGAVCFTKGCFVGQEVTARMHYKNIARRGFYVAEAPDGLPKSGAPIRAGGVQLGTMRGSQGRFGLAMLKFEETENALAAGADITVDNTALRLHAPPWLQPKLAQFRAARENQ